MVWLKVWGFWQEIENHKYLTSLKIKWPKNWRPKPEWVFYGWWTDQRVGFISTDVNGLMPRSENSFYLFLILLILFYFAGSSLDLLNIMVGSYRWCWAPWKFQWEDVPLQNIWWRTVGTKQLHFYSNSDFVAGDKYSFIAYGWVLCSGEPNLSGTSNHLVAQPVITVSLVLYTNLSKDFTLSQLVKFSRTNAESCVRESISARSDHFY